MFNPKNEAEAIKNAVTLAALGAIVLALGLALIHFAPAVATGVALFCVGYAVRSVVRK